MCLRENVTRDMFIITAGRNYTLNKLKKKKRVQYHLIRTEKNNNKFSLLKNFESHIINF